ncbi:prohead protease/major capsid protein fusion protein [Pseudogemmobacter sonorensis]|uniref:prohead protease/major capsid protein fusion protein n=1 Tax=Pseudogemmobacter sonorensis TaxID=2989681 RepID=UPI0036B7DAE9
MTFQFRAFDPRPATLDPAARTVEAIASTFADVQRPGFVERLAPKGCDLSRLIGGPVLDGHKAGSTRDQLGIIEAAEIRPEGLWVRLKFRANDSALAVLRDIAEGTLRGISVGYSVRQWRPGRENGAQVRTATAWQPIEISIVPIAADPAAHFRGVETMPDGNITTETTEAAEVILTRAEMNREIRSIGQLAGLPPDSINGQIDAEATPEEARTAAFEAMASRQAETRTTTTRANVGFSHDAPEVIATRAGEALFARNNPGHELSAPARQYAGFGLADLARDCCRRSGIAITGMTGESVITRAMHSSADFGLILADTTGRELRQAYSNAPSGIRPAARQVSAKDFRARRVLGLGNAPALDPINEGGEFTRGTIEETGESYKIGTFGKMFALSRQAIVNDDLGAFADIPRSMGQAAREAENRILADLLTASPAMSDGKAVFHDDHDNLKSGLSLTTAFNTLIDHARIGMRRQTSPGGDYINAVPRFIIVAPEDESLVEAGLAEIYPATAEDVNLFHGRLSPLADPRLEQGHWYVVADPAACPGLEIAFLAGAEGPQVESRPGWNTDAMEFRVRHDVGAGFVDWRGWYRLTFTLGGGG